VNFNKSECVVTKKDGEVLMRGIKTKENCYLWVPQRKSQADRITGMLHTMLEHQVSSEELDPLHPGSANNMRSISDSCFCKKNNLVSWTYEKQSGDSFARIMNEKQFKESRNIFQIFSQLPTKSNHITPTPNHTFSFSELPKTVRIHVSVTKHHHLPPFTKHC